MSKRVICQFCEKLLQDGDAQKGTEFKTCINCAIERNAGADPNRVLGADGKVVKSEEPVKPTHIKDITTDYVMMDGKILIQFFLDIPGYGIFDMGISEEQINIFSKKMEEIRVKAEQQVELRDNLRIEESEK